MIVLVFFFKQKTAYEMRISDWSSDVCSSDLGIDHVRVAAQVGDVVFGVGRELAQELLHVAVAHVGVRLRRARLGQFARQAGQVAEAGMRVGEGAEFVAVQQLARRARALQQHHLHAALRSEEHTSELQSLMRTSYAVFCLKKKI